MTCCFLLPQRAGTFPWSVLSAPRLRNLGGKVNPFLKQFVGEDAQAIDRGGFDPQYDRTECDRETTVGFRERNLGRREIAFGTNQHQDALGKMFATASPSFGGSMFRRIISQDFFQVQRAGLK